MALGNRTSLLPFHSLAHYYSALPKPCLNKPAQSPPNTTLLGAHSVHTHIDTQTELLSPMQCVGDALAVEAIML